MRMIALGSVIACRNSPTWSFDEIDTSGRPLGAGMRIARAAWARSRLPVPSRPKRVHELGPAGCTTIDPVLVTEPIPPLMLWVIAAQPVAGCTLQCSVAVPPGSISSGETQRDPVLTP